ncbi:DUF2892 domain-containing protein [Clostridium sp.]|uniref:YgaP family membrane protein n=1 Tax=Clostridium sp. TaxID=1506 RepID=UPI001A43BA64|nr:DUF2892 domain-containing protein [Clostridium sp.]MBK5242349.1 DUF2892 domain-containing protein [Clostridium sp.]
MIYIKFKDIGQNNFEVIQVKCNVGRTEQIIRIVIGILIALIGLYFRSWWGIIGIVPIITGSIHYCPISDILGISTCDVKEKQ